MYNILKTWVNRWFADEQAMLLLAILIVSGLVIAFMGNMLMPVFVSIVLAYLTFGLVQWLENFGIRHLLAVWGIYSLFIFGLIMVVLVLIPMTLRQGISFLSELPTIANQLRQALLKLPEQYPNMVSLDITKDIVDNLATELANLGHTLIGYSLSSIGQSITLIVYLVLVPILVFFFLKDGSKITNFMQNFLPEQRQLLTNVWFEMDQQLTNYIRGKVIETSIVGVCAYILFAVMGLEYSVLLAMMVGLSVIIPYVGAVLVTIPVAIVGYAQWGMGTELYTLMTFYFVLQMLDGNVLVPLLFSEAVNLHPVAIIIAVLVFGGLWGFWGVFFAIPLATLIKAIMRAWPDPAKMIQSKSH